MHRRIIQFGITLVALAAVALHIYFPSLRIDGITVTLLFLAALPWLAPLFRSVELPGGLKVEFQDIENATRKAEQSGLVEPQSTVDEESDERHVYAFESVVGSDPNLALAGLRIEIESRLREIAKAQGIQNQNRSLHRLTRELERKNALSHDEVSAISDLLPLLNSAAHGAEVDNNISEWALEFGPRLLDSLEDRAGEVRISDLLERWRQRDGAAVIEIGTALSKAFVSAPRSFLRSMRNDPESFDSWLEKLQHHTFTVFESRSEVEDDLYVAHYQKLKQLMQRTANKMRGTEFDAEAERILGALENMEIRRIW